MSGRLVLIQPVFQVIIFKVLVWGLFDLVLLDGVYRSYMVCVGG